MRERMNSETEVEQSERREFLGVEPAFFGTCLIMKTSSWPIQYLSPNIFVLFGRTKYLFSFSSRNFF
jgi:hypothetical protein